MRAIRRALLIVLGGLLVLVLVPVLQEHPERLLL